MATPSAYNQVHEVNPALAGALYQYNMLSNTSPALNVDPMLLQQNAQQEQVNRTVYVGNLHINIVEDQIIKVFSTCGVINLAKIATEGMGLKADAGTRFGFIEFQTREGAESATKLDGILLGGRPIRVGPSNGPIIQPTAYGPGAATMRNRPPLYKVSEGGFVILDAKAEEDINKRIEQRLDNVLSRLQNKILGSSSSANTANPNPAPSSSSSSISVTGEKAPLIARARPSERDHSRGRDRSRSRSSRSHRHDRDRHRDRDRSKDRSRSRNRDRDHSHSRSHHHSSSRHSRH